jgi:uncharacterized protein
VANLSVAREQTSRGAPALKSGKVESALPRRAKYRVATVIRMGRDALHRVLLVFLPSSGAAIWRSNISVFVFPRAVPDLSPNLFFAVVAVLFIGISKAGFGGGLGLLTTPLAVFAFGPRDAIGIILPLLCAGDAFSLWSYWRKWDARNLRFVLPGVVVGIVVGVQLIPRFSARELNVAIGGIAVSFVLFQLVKERIFRAEGAFEPNHKVGVPIGLATGITSTFAHGAGPIMSMFLIPQRLPKEVFVATNALIFTFVNWLKMPFFCLDRSQIDWPIFATTSLITRETMLTSLLFFPLVPVGAWIGVWMNRRISQRAFLNVVFVFLFLAGLELIFQFERFFPSR